MASPLEEVNHPKSSSPPTPSQWEPPVTCGVCGGDLKDPHLLPCLHCLCRECLPRAARENGRIKCPTLNCGDCSTTCRQPDTVAFPRCEKRHSECVPVQCTTVRRYVEGRKLVQKVASGERISCGNSTCDEPDAAATAFCYNCCLFFCPHCLKSHKALEGVIGKHNVKTVDAIRSGTKKDEAALFCKPSSLFCSRHKGEVLKYHCVLCDILMCQVCTVDKDSTHCPAYLSSEEPLPLRHLQAMEVAQKVVAGSKEQCKIVRETVEGWGSEMERKKETALCDTRLAFQALHAILDHREKELCNHIRAVSEARKENIDDIIHLCHQKEDNLSYKQSMLSFLSAEGSPYEVISYRGVVDAGRTQRRSETTISRVMQFLPKQKATLKAAIERFGCVEMGACPANCTMEPRPAKIRKFLDIDSLAFTLTTANREEAPCGVGGDMIQAFLRPKPPLPGPPIKAAVNDKENGQYEVTFDLTYTGECEMSVLVNGTHIQGSPLSLGIDVTLLLAKGKNITGACKGMLQFPQLPGCLSGVATSSNGTIFVTDQSNHKIHVFDHTRTFVRSFGQEGTGNGQLRSPRSVVTTSEGLLYIANDNGVDVLTENGIFVRRIGTGVLGTPFDAAVHNGEVFVADISHNCVAVFSQEGDFVRTIGSTGTGPGQFRYPMSVAISPNGALHVSDCHNCRVHVLSIQGEYIREFGNRQLSYPNKLQFTSGKHLLVADRFNNCIAVFNQSGVWAASIPCAGHPVGLSFDQKGDLLVACLISKCVRIV